MFKYRIVVSLCEEQMKLQTVYCDHFQETEHYLFVEKPHIIMQHASGMSTYTLINAFRISWSCPHVIHNQEVNTNEPQTTNQADSK